jgi:predicted secreted hydrolase
VTIRKVWGLPILALLIAGLAIFYAAQTRPAVVTGQLSAVAAASGNDDPRWQRVTAPRAFAFPVDHGPHETYQTEWWYYTGNLAAEDGHQFGFQLTFFRRGLDPQPTPRASHWATRNIYLAHFTISDLSGKKFYAEERFSRDGADLAGARGDPYHVWLGAWQATGSGPQGMTMRLQAGTDEIAIDLRLQSTKPPTLQGDHGYSVKGQGVGNASYYYSLTRMATTGVVTVGGRAFKITSGLSWMDHEWGTSKLEQGAVGWDWFALQLDDGREITWAQLRRADGSASDASFGTITAADGTTTRIGAHDLSLEVTAHWSSPRSQARYPAGWRIQIPKAGLTLQVTPRLADQELPVSIVYWEGAVDIKGQATGASGSMKTLAGHGYVELTGYLPSSSGTGVR